MTTKAPTSRHLTRYLAGPALALGLALGSPAVANAVPAWDIGGYDDCVAKGPGPDAEFDEVVEWQRLCCVNSGGVWKRGDGYWDCFAPGLESQGRNPMPSDAPTHVMQPSPLPGQGGDLGSAPEGGLE
jgi:hypothetical protein